MKPLHKNVVASLAASGTVVLTLAASVLLLGQSRPPALAPAAPAMNRNLVVLDPAHGGPDAGATLADHAIEKDVTLAMAARLRAELTGAGFTVVSTREADPSNPLTSDQRAEIANRAHAVACIVLHATGSGSGVHVYTSALQPSDPPDNTEGNFRLGYVPVPWEMAQTHSVPQSLSLANDLSAALGTGNLPVMMGRAAVRPLDNLMCPAVAIEVAPLGAAGGSATPVTDADYQQRVAGTLAGALRSWRDHAEPPVPRAAATSKDWMDAIGVGQARAIGNAMPATQAGGVAATGGQPKVAAKTDGKTVAAAGGGRVAARGTAGDTANVAAPERSQ